MRFRKPLALPLLFLATAACAAVANSPACAQEPPPAVVPPSVEQAGEEPAEKTAPQELPPAMIAFGQFLGGAEQTLQASQPYRVKVDSEWLSLRNGQIELSGTNHLQVLVGGNNRLRLEAREQLEQPAQFIAVADGTNLIRVHGPSGKFSREETSTPQAELAGCEITQSILKICGSTLLLSNQAKDSVFHQLTQVADLGDDAKLRHFQIGLADGRLADVWFSQDAPHLPVKLVTHEVKSIGQDLKQELQITANFDWELNVNLNDADFSIDLPGDYQQVSSLADTLAGQGSEELVNLPLPQFTLVNLAGQPVPIEKENRPVLLYFWATWAAPTTEDLPGVVEFAKQLESQGVRVVAVNVAEDKEVIKAFLEANKVALDVAIDQTGEVIHDLRITELPAVVLIDKDHHVRAIHEEVTQDIRPKLVEALKQLAEQSK